MKNFDLNAYGVKEMSETQTREVNGGIYMPLPTWPLTLVFYVLEAILK